VSSPSPTRRRIVVYTAVPVMTTSLGIAFWNTRLAPPRARVGRDGPTIAAAVAMIEAVVETGIQFFGLCEVDEDVMRLLSRHVPRLRSWRFEIVDGTTDAKGWNLGFFYDPAVFSKSSYSKLEVQCGSRAHRVGLAIEATFIAEQPPLYICLSHWPSQSRSDNEHLRIECAKQLYLEFSEDKRIVMIDDYNDEPHAPSISDHLATRDPKRALSRRRMFNASWLFFSGDVGNVDGAFGTVYYNGGLTRWKTFDQIMVSPSLLAPDDGGFVLASVHRFDAIFQKHNPASPAKAQFDHLPIAAQFRSEP
jgi:hypothetical protein